MSDDEVYVGSPYDDYDDDWDDDQARDLADDLAQHAAYSPVWQETPLGELDPYHSDWEYYSDDYYDDDPALLVQNTLDGNGSNADDKSQRLQQKRGRKRKLDEARESREVDTETRSLMKSIQGTVWAQEQEDPTAVFRRGDQKKVALLKNWRDLFGIHDRGLPDAGWSQARTDETWANDMGLAAMGLLQQHEQRDISGQAGTESNNTFEDDEDSGDDAAVYAMSSDDGDLDDIATSGRDLDVSANDSTMIRDLSEVGEVLQNRPRSPGSTVHEDDHDHGGRVRKRRKKQGLPSPPTSTESGSLRATIGQNNVKDGHLSSVDSPMQAQESMSDQTEPRKIKTDSESLPLQVFRQSTSKSRKRKASTGAKDTNATSRENTERSPGQQLTSQSLTKKRKKSAAQESSPPRRSRRLQNEAA